MLEIDEKVVWLQCFSRLEKFVVKTPYKNPYLLTQYLLLLFGVSWLGLFVLRIFYL